MKNKLRALKQTKAQKLFNKTPKLLEAKGGVITAVYRHHDKQIIRVGDQLLNFKTKQVITGIFCDTQANGNMYVTTDLNTAWSAIATIVLAPKMIFV